MQIQETVARRLHNIQGNTNQRQALASTDNEEGEPGKTCADRSTFSCLAVTVGVAVPGIFQGITTITQCYGSLLWRTLHGAEVTLFKLCLLYHTQIAKHWTKLSKHEIINFILIK